MNEVTFHKQLNVISHTLQSHPELRFCPGPNCTVIVRAFQNKAKRITCSECKTTFWLVIHIFMEETDFYVN